MAKLYFEIEADYKKVIRLREEIEKLQKTMKGFSSHTSANEIKKLEAELKSLREEYGRLTNKAAKSAASIEKAGMSIGKALAAVGGVAALKQLGSEIIRVRGEFQEMETAIETLVGKEMSDRLIPQIKELAKVSPLTMTDIVGAEKMMLGFNIEADKTIGFLKALSDVSMGNSQKFNSLTLAFSQMSAAGKLMGSDLNQMINAGFNPLQQISAKTGKSIATLKEEMSKGAISAEMVQQAFIDATSAGGKFYKMSENASKTINGQISMMQDAWDSALNEMGIKSEGIIMEGIQATTTLIQNYETVGRVLVGLVATYGTYKAALIATIALEKAQVISRLAAIKHTSLLSAAIGVLTKKVALLNAVAKANPYVLLATAIVGVGTAMWALSDHTTEAEKGLAAYNREQEKAANKQTDAKRQLEEWVSVLNDENAGYGKRQEAMMKMKAVYGDLATQFMDEKGHIADLTGLWEQYGKKAWEAKKKAKEAEIANLQMQLGSAEWSYNLNEKLNNRSKMKEAQNRIDFLKPQIEQAKKDLEQINSEAPKEDKDGGTNYKTAYDTAKKDWETAKKKLDSIKKDKSKYTQKEYNDAKKDESTKKKIYENLGGVTGKQLDKQIKDEEKKNKELLSIRRKNEQADIDLKKESSEKRIAQIELDYKNEIDAYNEAVKKYGKTNEVESMRENAENKRVKALSDVYKGEFQQMNEYLKEYGTFQQKKLAIAQEYDKKISETTNEWDKKNLQKQKNKELSQVENEALQQRVDWVSVFGDLGTLVDEDLKKTLESLKEVIDSDEFKKKDATDQKTIIDAFNRLQEEVGYSFKGMDFEGLGQSIKRYQDLQLELNGLKQKEAETNRELIEAQKDYEEALKTGDKNIINNAKENVDKKGQTATEAGNAVKNQEQSIINSGEAIRTSANSIKGALTDVEEMIRNFASGSLEGVWEGFENLESLLGSNKITTSITKGLGDMIGGAVGEAIAGPFGGEILSSALGILDMLKGGIENVISGLIDTVLGAVQGLLDSVLNFKIVQSVGKSLYEGIGSILDTITFGGMSSWLSSSNAKEVAETTERLTSRNEMLTQSIDALRDEMEKARGMQSVDAYDKAVEKQKELIKNQGDVLAAQMGYHGAHHSNSYYIAKALTDSDWAKISTTVGKKVASTSDLWNLSPEDLKKVSQLTDIWDKIYNGGKYDKSEYIDAYLELAGSLEEMEKELNESLTQVSFDSMYDGFLNTLMDMESTSKDFADDISEYFMKAMLTNKIGELYSEELEKWYNKYADYMKDDGQLDETEMNELKGEYDRIVNKAIAERDAIAAATGYDKSTYSQEATSKGYQTMSQETGDELNGRFTALQVAGEEIKNQTSILTITANEIKAINSGIRDIAAGIQDQMASSYLELVAINENTGLSAKYLKSIESGITDIKDNIKNL